MGFRGGVALCVGLSQGREGQKTFEVLGGVHVNATKRCLAKMAARVNLLSSICALSAYTRPVGAGGNRGDKKFTKSFSNTLDDLADIAETGRRHFGFRAPQARGGPLIAFRYALSLTRFSASL